MKVAIRLFLVLFAVTVLGEAYHYVYASYTWSTLGGVRTLTVHLHNNAGKNADCTVTIFNRSSDVAVPAYGTAETSFSDLPEDAQPRYSCEAQ